LLCCTHCQPNCRYRNAILRPSARRYCTYT
jgi:hypothetical protein